LGIGDWGLGIGDWAQSPIPNPQSPIPNPKSPFLISDLVYLKLINNLFYIIKFYFYLNEIIISIRRYIKKIHNRKT
jgi:hypothetical protein